MTYELILILCAIGLIGYYVWVFYDEKQTKLEARIKELESKVDETKE